MIKEAIGKVVKGDDLTEKEMEGAMGEILTGKATSAQIGSFITALRIKGETVDEITGAAKTMRARAEKICLNNHLITPIRILEKALHLSQTILSENLHIRPQVRDFLTG